MLSVVDHSERSDTGLERRDNEDAAFVQLPVFVVADGMGGAQAGGDASRMAVEVFQRGVPDEGTPEQRLAALVREANRRIHDRARGDERRAGMGTTLTAAYVDGREVSFAHVGDSRAYLLRDGELTRLTRDHSLVEELVRRGRLTEEEAQDHPQRSIITRALGPEPEVEVDTITYPARAGDVFLLCSDGLTSMVSEARVAEILTDAESMDQAARALIEEANAAGGRDNITVVLFRLDDSRARARPSAAKQARADGRRAGARAGAAGSVRALIGRRHRLRRRALVPLVVVVVLLVLLAGGAWLAIQAVYFVGTDRAGFVTIFQGVPFDGPFGLHLYSSYYESPVPASDLSSARRHTLLDHHLRSLTDASDLVRRLELGQLTQ